MRFGSLSRYLEGFSTIPTFHLWGELGVLSGAVVSDQIFLSVVWFGVQTRLVWVSSKIMVYAFFPIKRPISSPAAYVFNFFPEQIRRYNQGEDTPHLCTRKIDRFFSPPGASSLLKKVKVWIVRGEVDVPVVFTVGDKERSPNPRVFVVLLMFFFVAGVFTVMVRSFLSFSFFL